MIDIITISEFERHPKIRRILARRDSSDSKITKTVARILQRIRREGDRALRELTYKFDGVRLRKIRIPFAEVERQAQSAPREVRRALRQARRNIEAFHRRQVEKSWLISRGSGVRIGQRLSPIASVGIYVPGGTAAYPSTVLMNAIPAIVAGVKRIAVVTPPQAFAASPSLAAALVELRLKEVYGVGGAQAVAALAYGTEAIAPVDKIVGPGNRYVAAAKRLVFGTVDIDMIAGPSEVVVVADQSADPRLVAADMLAQAEHDTHASALCITSSMELAQRVQAELDIQSRSLERATICKQSLRDFGAVVVTHNLSEAETLVNALAPEHLELHLRRPEPFSRKIKNAGAIFLGPFSPEAVGDYLAGPNHVLPTNGTARFSSPLGVYDFMKRTSIIQYSRDQLKREARAITTLARAEQLTAHARSVEIRLKRKRG